MCCFAGDTRITLADGSSKAIKDIRKGDVIKGQNGTNCVVEVYRPFLHFRRKYSINDGEYFTTAEHPFQTTEGWKAIKPYRRWWDPECWENYLHSHKDLEEIKPLWVGDKIITEKGQIEVKSIKSSWNPLRWFERVYNIGLTNDNTYYANGMLAHNKGGGIIGKILRPIVKIFKKVINIFTGFLGAFGMSFDTPEYGGGADYESQQQGITLNKQSNVAGIPVVYGKRKVGGVRVFVATDGKQNQNLYVCLAVAEGQINAFKKIYINDELQVDMNNTLTADNNTTHKVRSSSKYYYKDAKAEFQFFTGGEDQGASSLLKEHPKWNDDHRLRGVAYVACKFKWLKAEYDDDGNQTVFNPWQGGIPEVQVEIEGRKVLSGDYSGHGTTVANTYGSEIGSFTYSDNPADCLLDFLRNPRYGKGLNDHRIDWAAFRSAQQVCDDTSQNFGGSLGTAQFLNCNTYLKPEDTMFNNAKKLLQTCRGFLPYVNGQYQLKIETAETTPSNLLVLNDDKIIGSIKVSSQDKNSKYNQAKVTFNNAEKDYESDTAIFGDPNFLAEDDGEDLILNIGAPGIIERERALQYAEYMVKRSRKQLSIQLTATSEAQDLVAGDLVAVEHKYKTSLTGTDYLDYLFKAPTTQSYSDPNKLFRVVSQKLNYDGTVDLQLLEHQNDIYDVTQQQEDRDLSPIEDKKDDDDKDDGGGKPDDGKKPGDPNKHFTVQGFRTSVDGKPRVMLSINNNTYQDVDPLAVKIIYNISLGNNRQPFETMLPNRFGSSFLDVNGEQFQFGDTVEVNISSEYQNGTVRPIESHIVTMPSDTTSASSGSI